MFTCELASDMFYGHLLQYMDDLASLLSVCAAFPLLTSMLRTNCARVLSGQSIHPVHYFPITEVSLHMVIHERSCPMVCIDQNSVPFFAHIAPRYRHSVLHDMIRLLICNTRTVTALCDPISSHHNNYFSTEIFHLQHVTRLQLHAKQCTLSFLSVLLGSMRNIQTARVESHTQIQAEYSLGNQHSNIQTLEIVDVNCLSMFSRDFIRHLSQKYPRLERLILTFKNPVYHYTTVQRKIPFDTNVLRLFPVHWTLCSNVNLFVLPDVSATDASQSPTIARFVYQRQATRVDEVHSIKAKRLKLVKRISHLFLKHRKHIVSQIDGVRLRRCFWKQHVLSLIDRRHDITRQDFIQAISSSLRNAQQKQSVMKRCNELAVKHMQQVDPSLHILQHRNYRISYERMAQSEASLRSWSLYWWGCGPHHPSRFKQRALRAWSKFNSNQSVTETLEAIVLQKVGLLDDAYWETHCLPLLDNEINLAFS